MNDLLKGARRVFVRDGKVRPNWRFAVLVILYWGCGPVLNPILTKLHFPDRGMTATALALNEGLDFVLIALFSWVVARLGRARISEYGLAFRSGWGRLLLS
jgi:hypothetical protein